MTPNRSQPIASKSDAKSPHQGHRKMRPFLTRWDWECVGIVHKNISNHACSRSPSLPTVPALTMDFNGNPPSSLDSTSHCQPVCSVCCRHVHLSVLKMSILFVNYLPFFCNGHHTIMSLFLNECVFFITALKPIIVKMYKCTERILNFTIHKTIHHQTVFRDVLKRIYWLSHTCKTKAPPTIGIRLRQDNAWNKIDCTKCCLTMCIKTKGFTAVPELSQREVRRNGSWKWKKKKVAHTYGQSWTLTVVVWILTKESLKERLKSCYSVTSAHLANSCVKWAWLSVTKLPYRDPKLRRL